MRLADFVVDFIAKLGVRHVFMLPGGGAMHLNDSLGRCCQLQYVCNLHEQGGAIAAEAYGQIAGLGVLMVTTGPGGTNAITGVAGAWLESTPMLVISGQVKCADLVGLRAVRQIGFQEIDIVRIVSPITKFAVTVTDPLRIRSLMEEAVWKATHGRKGPAWLDIPLDVQACDVDPDRLAPFVPPPSDAEGSRRIALAVSKTIELLKQARRPIVLVGNGVRLAGAVDEFLAWAEAIKVPILTTWKTLDVIPENHPLYAGRPGAVGQRGANFSQQTSDLILILGARMDYGQTAYNHANFAPKAQKVVVDVDPYEIGKLQMDLAVSLAADVGDFLRELTVQTRVDEMPNWQPWMERCAELKSRYPMVLPEFRTKQPGVNNYVLVESIGKLLRNGDILAPGSSGACSEITAQAVPAVKGMRFVNTHGLGAMGFGVPAALGACLASGNRRTICIDGDGGFVLNCQELGLAARLQLPIKYFILNNGGYGSIRATQKNYFESRFVGCDVQSGLNLPSTEKTAESFGITYRRIESQENLDDDLAAILESNGPTICEVMMSPDQFTQPKVSSRQRADGQMVTMPMEDLWPFLDREEFARNMTTEY